MIQELLQVDTKNVRNVGHYTFGEGSLSVLPGVVQKKRLGSAQHVIYLVDEYFRENGSIVDQLGAESRDRLIYVATDIEPTTNYIDRIYQELVNEFDPDKYSAVVGIGGGITLDTAKAISNLLGNGGRASDYQGWDLLEMPGIYKIGIPTLSGTGAEATRTCVMTNPNTGAKMGMNSDYSIYEQLILDPKLTLSVPREQYFYTGMDSFIHCIESLSGMYRNSIADAFSTQSLKLCREVFLSEEMQSDENRSKLMVASYLGGCAIASSYVGMVHPFSAGLSVVFGIHHGIANCIALNALADYYPEAHAELIKMARIQTINIPKGICAGLSDRHYRKLYESTIVHEKPLANALGPGFRDELTIDKVSHIFGSM